jgi:glycosyltransferase involved in cell wall biosynthesis
MVVYSFYENDTRVMQYASALARRGDEVDIIALRLPGQPKYEVIEGVHVHRIQIRQVNERGRFSYAYRLMRFCILSGVILSWKHLSRRYSLIHVHNVPDFLVFSALVPRLFGTPVILDIHDVLPEMYADKFSVSKDSLIFKTMLQVEKLSIAFSSHTIIANHLWYDRLLSRSVRPEKLTTIRNYPDPHNFHPCPKDNKKKKFLIVYPGSLNWYQGVDVAIKAFARVANQMPEAEFHIYGEGSAKPSFTQLAKTLGLSDRVLFHPFLSAKEIAKVMASADLAIEPKQARSAFANEASSMKILEFMAVDVPLIVSRTRIHSYYYDDSMVKFFTPHDDTELADYILELYKDANLRKQFVANARQYVARNNWNVRKQEYLALVDWLVDPSRPRAEAEPLPRTDAPPTGSAHGYSAPTAQ